MLIGPLKCEYPFVCVCVCVCVCGACVTNVTTGLSYSSQALWTATLHVLQSVPGGAVLIAVLAVTVYWLSALL